MASNYVYFYGGVFSNFYQCKMVENDVVYCCSEQYFMKKKQELFEPENTKLASLILNEKKPSIIKQYGRQIENFNQDIWNKNKMNIMIRALELKFTQNENLRNLLINTTDKILVEASPYDKIWGIGISVDAANKGQAWRGENLLGKCLMIVRDRVML